MSERTVTEAKQIEAAVRGYHEFIAKDKVPNTDVFYYAWQHYKHLKTLADAFVAQQQQTVAAKNQEEVAALDEAYGRAWAEQEGLPPLIQGHNCRRWCASDLPPAVVGGMRTQLEDGLLTFDCSETAYVLLAQAVRGALQVKPLASKA